jgi:ribosome biogenesis GTPase A
MDIQWYPGHMTKAKRQMQEDIKLIDLMIEIVDARAPQSSRNPDLSELGKNKARLILMNKTDLADEIENKKWADYFKRNNIACIFVDSRNRATLKSIPSVIQEVCKEKIERDLKRGIKNRPVRAMIVGIPNVGKSTFINSYAGKACAKTGNKPGVTKGKQWINLSKNIQMLDTPGVLWPKFEDAKAGVNLAFIGSIKDDILNIEELGIEFLDYVTKHYRGRIAERYGVSEEKSLPEILYSIGEKRGCIVKGNEISYEKAAALVLDDFRSGKLGRITLENAPVGDMNE